MTIVTIMRGLMWAMVVSSALIYFAANFLIDDQAMATRFLAWVGVGLGLLALGRVP